MRIVCDRCGHKAKISTRRNETPYFTRLYCVCTNPECAHSFVMNLEFSHTLSPSALDLPEQTRTALSECTSRREVQQLLLA
jgi:hypothetical protein